MIFDFLKICEQRGKKIKGILHVGSHDGGELPYYLSRGIENTIFCEANPEIYTRLLERCSGIKGVRCFNYAIADKEDFLKFYITNNDSASSSILKLKKHSERYPNIIESKQIVVQSKTIDGLFQEHHIDFENFNVLNIDIQGAELIAMKGMSKYLTFCDVIYTEVNFEELYDGCSLVSEIDEYLKQFGFNRVSTIDTGYGWGDALYLKEVTQ